MSHIEERDIIRMKITGQRVLTSPETATTIPAKVSCTDWQRETEETGGQSFYWSECPLDVSLGGSEDF